MSYSKLHMYSSHLRPNEWRPDAGVPVLSRQMDPVQKAVINHTFGVTPPRKKPIISCNICHLRFNSTVSSALKWSWFSSQKLCVKHLNCPKTYARLPLTPALSFPLLCVSLCCVSFPFFFWKSLSLGEKQSPNRDPQTSSNFNAPHCRRKNTHEEAGSSSPQAAAESFR